MDPQSPSKGSQVVSQLAALRQLVAEHSSRQETTFAEALALTESEQESTPRLYFLLSRSPLSPIPEEDDELDPAEVSLHLIHGLTNAMNQVFDMEQMIVGIYRDYIESTVPELKRSKIQLQKAQSQYDRESEKVEMLTERLATLEEELEAIQLSKTETDWCEKCQSAQDRASAAESRTRKLKREIEQLREENETLEGRKSRAETEYNRVSEEFEELGKTHEEVCARLEKVENEGKMKAEREVEALRRAAAAEDSLDRLQSDFLALKQSKEAVEVANSDLIRRLEASQAQVSATHDSLQEAESECAAAKQSLDKARVLVKRLNEESEYLAKSLQNTEKSERQARKESHQAERTMADLHKKSQESDVMRRTEERLRQEILSLKQEIKRITDERAAEVDDLQRSIEQLLDEKSQLESGLTILEEKLEVIERENGERDRALQSAQSLSRELEAEVARRNEDIRKLREEAEMRESEKEAEIALYKRQAENVLRYYSTAADTEMNRSRPLQSSASSPLKKKTQVKLTTTSRLSKDEEKEHAEKSAAPVISAPDNLLLQLEESLHREALLKREIERLAASESRFVAERIAHLSAFDAAMRPEVERWMMRNEELEQRLLETLQKSTQMQRLLQDCQKMVLVKTRQAADQRRIWESLRSEMQATIDFLLVEVQNRDQMILEEFVPRSQATLSSSLSAAHGKIQQMNIDFSRLRSTAEEACVLLEREKDRSDALLTDNQRLTEELLLMKDNFEHWGQLLSGNRSLPPVSSGDPETPFAAVTIHITELLDHEKELSNELSEKKRLFQELNAARQETELLKQRYQDEIRGMELQHKEREAKWTSDRLILAEEIRQIKGIAQKDSDAKLHLQTELEVEVENCRAEAETLQDQLAQRNAEVVALHKRLAEVQKALDALTSEYDVAKTRLLKEVENLEIQLRNTQEELAKTKVEVRESQYEVRTLAERHEHTIHALHAEIGKEYDFRPKSVLATYQAMSGRASPYTSPSRQERVESPELVQELYLVKAALKKREETISFLENELKSSEQALARKTAYVNDLEQQLEFFRNRKEGNQMFVDTEVETFKMDLSDMRAEPQGQYETLEEQLSRLKKKRESEKRSFQKRVKEFELILRYLEDQINRLTDSTPRPQNAKMAVLISELSVKNSTLDAWLKTLCQKLENYGKLHTASAGREKRAYTDFAAVLISSGVNAAEAKRVLDYISLENSDLERAAKDLVALLRSAVAGTTRHRRVESFGAIRAVLIDTESADSLLTVSREVSELERLWRERAANLLQVSAKADDLVSSVRRMDRAHPSSERILDKVLDMFQKIFRSFQSDLSGDLLHISTLAEALNQVLSSSPDADASQTVTMSSYHRRTSQALREERPRSEAPPLLLDQMDRLNSELTRH